MGTTLTVLPTSHFHVQNPQVSTCQYVGGNQMDEGGLGTDAGKRRSHNMLVCSSRMYCKLRQLGDTHMIDESGHGCATPDCKKVRPTKRRDRMLNWYLVLSRHPSLVACSVAYMFVQSRVRRHVSIAKHSYRWLLQSLLTDF